MTTAPNELPLSSTSAGPTAPFSIHAMADDIAALIRHLNLGRADVMGFSLTGGHLLFLSPGVAGGRAPERLALTRSRARRSTVSGSHGSFRGLAMPASSAEDVPAPLLSRIIEAMRPVQIWLFGSRARGGARPTSDWDLLVVMPDDATDDELDLMHAWQTVRDLRIPADVIPVRLREFEEARDHAGTLVRTVVGEGRRVYAR